jgi:hypothetical protein
MANGMGRFSTPCLATCQTGRSVGQAGCGLTKLNFATPESGTDLLQIE